MSATKFFLLAFLLFTTQAKLDVVSMDVEPNDEIVKSSKQGPTIIRKKHVDRSYIRLGEALRNHKNAKHEVDFNAATQGISPDRIRQAREVFDYLDSQVSPDDATMIRFAVNRLSNGTSSSAKTIILEMQLLQSYLDQIDNAVDFCEAFNGVQLLKKLFLNHTSIDVRTEIIRTIGVATQNNRQVIEKVLEAQFLPLILSDMNSSTNCSYVTRLVHTMSALTRQNQDGLNRFVKLKGNLVLEQVVKKFGEIQGIRTCNTVVPKIMDFVADVTALNVDDRRLFRNTRWCWLMSNGLRSTDYALRESSLRYFERIFRLKACQEQRSHVEGSLKWILNDFDQAKHLNNEELEFKMDHAARAAVLLNRA